MIRGQTRMFKHILVPIDLSEKNARTLRLALMLATQSRARVTLLHVVQHVVQIPLGEMRPFYRRLVATSRRRLAEAAKAFAAEGLSVGTEVLVGEPAREVVRLAMAKKADLVVMGSHKVHPARRNRGWGTTSYKVGIFCQCPILLVK
jgi:nucleotide-binding universal stress UspA family protein